MKPKLMPMAIAAVVAALPSLSPAAVVNFDGWAYGSGNTVNVGVPSHIGPAGGFKGSLDFNAEEETAGWVDRRGSSFLSYCVEINEHFSFSNGNMSDYTIRAAADYVRSYSSTSMGGERANRLGQLMSYVASSPQSVDSASESTSLQLAIWNIIYDTDDSLNAGSFLEYTANGAFNAAANVLLSASQGAQSVYDVFVLTKSNSQDFLLLRPSTSTFSEVPEPASLALAFGALGALGACSRRRQHPPR